MNGLSPGFVVLVSLLCITILVIKKEHIAVPLIVAMCFLPADIPVQIGVFHIYAVRAVALTGLFRLLLNGDYSKIKPNKIDKLFILYNIIGSIIYILASLGTAQAIIFKSGVFVDTIILYLVIRASIESKNTIHLIVKIFAICVLVLLPFVLFEYFSSRNLFSIFGRSDISIRDGEIRAAATFSHAILFGSFAAAIAPILWAEYKIAKEKKFLISFICCVFFVYSSSSSGPIVVLAGGFFFLTFFKWKEKGRLFAWGIFFSLLFIHFARESPVWHFLYVRVSVKGSSTGWHRYMLTEAAIEEFKNWWLMGYGDVGPQWHTQYWPYAHQTFTDVTNHYLLEGVRGGFLTMCLFILLCYKVIKTLGAASIKADKIEDQWLWWGFTVMMITHCITFLSVAYFGQITMLLYLTIAVAAYAFDQKQSDTISNSSIR